MVEPAGPVARLGAVALRFIALALAGIACPGTGAPYDLVLRGGVVVDGTGAMIRVADVAINAGRVVASWTAEKPCLTTRPTWLSST